MTTPLLPDIALVVARLKGIPGVTNVVAGNISNTPHSHRPGEMKLLAKDTAKNIATIRAFSSRGMQNLFVYAKDLDALHKSLVVIPSKFNVRKPSSVLPAESKIERKDREQPIYPADPSPIKSADAVKDSDLVGRLVTVTVDIALNWLERNSHNRPLRNADVQKYANDMRAGRWLPGGVVIKFAKDGTIINGQHTLWAVIESKTPIQVYVLTGVDPDVVMVEDDHARRRLTDVIRLTHPGSMVGNIHTAVATMLRHSMAWHRGDGGETRTAITRQQEMSFLDENIECVEFAVKSMSNTGNKRGISIAAVLAPIARAWHTEDRDKLKRFASVLQTGLVEDTKENVAITLRNWLMAATATASTMAVKKTVYQRVERALRAFLDGEKLSLLRPSTEELFLMPGERKTSRKR